MLKNNEIHQIKYFLINIILQYLFFLIAYYAIIVTLFLIPNFSLFFFNHLKKLNFFLAIFFNF